MKLANFGGECVHLDEILYIHPYMAFITLTIVANVPLLKM